MLTWTNAAGRSPTVLDVDFSSAAGPVRRIPAGAAMCRMASWAPPTPTGQFNRWFRRDRM